MITFIGNSHAADHLREAARVKGVEITEDLGATELVFVSQDTETNRSGQRELKTIRALVHAAREASQAPIVLTCQVPPGFTRSLGLAKMYHQAETLRIKDATHRALNPDYIVVGCATYESYELLPAPYRRYLEAFSCPVQMVTYEDAEFSKVAVNMFLAAQVEATNMLAEAAIECDASWWHVAEVLKRDKRIGPHAYLEPGRWQESRHLMRDYATLLEVLPSNDLLLAWR